MSCGFVSTLKSEFRLEQKLRVCTDCKADYGKDEDVTRWIDAAAAKMADTMAQDAKDAKPTLANS